MAVYEYKCKKCNKIIEKQFEFAKAPKKIKCKKCKKMCDRHFSPPMIQFVGSGFYSTDNRN